MPPSRLFAVRASLLSPSLLLIITSRYYFLARSLYTGRKSVVEVPR